MTTIYTATATNNGFYIALAVAATDAASARDAFEPMLAAEADEGGDYTLGDDLTARFAFEEGDYPNDDGSGSVDLDTVTVDELLANPGHVITLDSGGNG